MKNYTKIASWIASFGLIVSANIIMLDYAGEYLNFMLALTHSFAIYVMLFLGYPNEN